MLSGGQIEPSDTPWASPVVLVTKKDGSMHFCVDYRRLNTLTVKDAYPLPCINDSLQLLGNQQWFSTMDLASGCLQVAMSPEAKRKAAFVTNEGLFQFRVMPFDLCNAPATFECLMDRVLCGMKWSRCLVYLDDVISFGASIPDALTRLEEVLCRQSDVGLQFKGKKCTFMQTEVAFLGHIVGRTGLACDPEKISAGDAGGSCYVVVSSLCVQITAHSGGYRNSAMVMGCWPAGTCCWASSRLLLSTVRGLNMQTRKECLDSVDSV